MSSKIQILSLSIFLFLSLCLKAQKADERVFELVSKNNYFLLDQEYPTLKKNLILPYTKWVAEALLAARFNQPDIAINAIDTLSITYYEQIGRANCYKFIGLLAEQLITKGNYAECAKGLNAFITAARKNPEKENLESHMALYKFSNSLRNEKAPIIWRPDRDIETNFKIGNISIKSDSSVTDNKLIYIPVKIHNKEYDFLFDTGAARSSMTQELANEIGLKVLIDSVSIQGTVNITNGHMLGVLDSLSISDIKCKNILFCVIKSGTDSLFFKRQNNPIHCIIGLDLMKRIGEINIYPKENKIIFPIKQNKIPINGRNLISDNNLLRANLFDVRNNPLPFLFDTGASRTQLSLLFFQNNKEWVEMHGNRKQKINIGIGGGDAYEVYEIPSLDLNLNGNYFKLANVSINSQRLTDSVYENQNVLGSDFISMFKKVIINFDKMFIDVEK